MQTEGKYNNFHVNKTQRSGRTVITVVNSWRWWWRGWGGMKVSHILQKVNFNWKHNGSATKQQKAHFNRQYCFLQLHSLRLWIMLRYSHPSRKISLFFFVYKIAYCWTSIGDRPSYKTLRQSMYITLLHGPYGPQ